MSGFNWYREDGGEAKLYHLERDSRGVALPLEHWGLRVLSSPGDSDNQQGLATHALIDPFKQCFSTCAASDYYFLKYTWEPPPPYWQLNQKLWVVGTCPQHFFFNFLRLRTLLRSNQFKSYSYQAHCTGCRKQRHARGGSEHQALGLFEITGLGW